MMYIMRIVGQTTSYKKINCSIVDPVLETRGDTHPYSQPNLEDWDSRNRANLRSAYRVPRPCGHARGHLAAADLLAVERLGQDAWIEWAMQSHDFYLNSKRRRIIE